MPAFCTTNAIPLTIVTLLYALRSDVEGKRSARAMATVRRRMRSAAGLLHRGSRVGEARESSIFPQFE